MGGDRGPPSMYHESPGSWELDYFSLQKESSAAGGSGSDSDSYLPEARTVGERGRTHKLR